MKKIRVKANWMEAGENHKITRYFDTTNEARKYIKLWKEYLQNVEIEDVIYDEENQEYIPKKNGIHLY